jgi:uncharacterized protein YuzE
MQLEYDLDVRALYIKLSDREVARTVEVGSNTQIDLDETGTVVGIEVLDIDEDWPVAEIIRDLDLPPGEVEHIATYFPFAAPAPTFSVARTPVAAALRS